MIQKSTIIHPIHGNSLDYPRSPSHRSHQREGHQCQIATPKVGSLVSWPSFQPVSIRACQLSIGGKNRSNLIKIMAVTKKHKSWGYRWRARINFGEAAIVAVAWMTVTLTQSKPNPIWSYLPHNPIFWKVPVFIKSFDLSGPYLDGMIWIDLSFKRWFTCKKCEKYW